ncbi:four helix bundle protein [Chryseotalea sanaruensis]|uniref:Four helix bundle protein n=1 Tax=Chryseotalea sanaruensis TaxID=2482724 RepID=A0A401U582_9BACT|nr:four helix bundle protein [Chryseotalea sanaruensis]GCC50000.1 four helix bundle protein [Chryseotalea sanaruensis]
MAKIERFEDLNCWKDARILVREIYFVCEEGKHAKDFDTKSQLKRAALSVMNNIAEGFGRFSSKDFIRFLNIAQSSALEVRSIFYVALDIGYLTTEKVAELQKLTDDSRNQILGLIRYLNTKTKNESQG